MSMKAHICSKYTVKYEILEDWKLFEDFVRWIVANNLESEVNLCYNDDIHMSDWFEFHKQGLQQLKLHNKYDKAWDSIIEYMLTDSDPDIPFVRVEIF